MTVYDYHSVAGASQTPVSEVGSFIFLLDAYDHYIGGKRGWLWWA